ncbi:hypothetical protein QJS04_geneDACA022523 [Acorus gramineus]|uniref:Cell wall protein n=1 Tax=Acorus gramineus TaxID=55184 RepID=A0AAV9A7I6_ACOGR|nr:hypothetical protein QJS04_geneDACA022523 [Acorus gramineus]
MASSFQSTVSYLLILSIILSVTQATIARRQAPSNAKAMPHVKYPKTTSDQEGTSTNVKQPQTFHEGSVLIPGFGRFIFNPRYRPQIVGLGTDHSFGAAINSQYLPGNDDTFIPNLGHEVPNPAHVPVGPETKAP